MITPDRIVQLYRQRRTGYMALHARMRAIKQQYEGEVQVPLPELDKNERPAVANLITQGIDQMAMRVASTVPSITYPPLRPGIEKSEEYARIRRLANYSWWQANRFDRKQRKRARWLIGYAASPVIIRPNFKKGIPMWLPCDPLATYPAPTADPDDICPSDAIVANTRTLGWLLDRYPNQARGLEMGKDAAPDAPVEVLEYVDADEHVMIAIGREPSRNYPGQAVYLGAPTESQGAPFLELERFANRCGRCPLVYPTRPSLDRATSQFDQMPDLYYMQARAMALWQIAATRNVFPEVWFISRQNEQVNVLEEADGPAGIPGKVAGGDMKEVVAQSPPQIGQLIEMMERAQRVTAALSQDLGGENPSNVRTGRAGEQLLSAAIDFWVEEAQKTLGASYEEENRIAVAVARNYFGDAPKSFYVSGFKGVKGPVDYVPNTHFETDNNIVEWPMAGADGNSLVIGLGQRLGLDEISIETAQELDPFVKDKEEEQRRLTAQSVNKAFMASVDQAVAGGQVGPTELARFVELVMTGQMDLYKAWQQLHSEMQQQQATQQQGPEAGGPAPGSPQAMPGLAAPGQQAAQGLPQPGPAAGVSQPSPGMQHMQQLIGALRKPPGA